jgi:hypothetical protein
LFPQMEVQDLPMMPHVWQGFLSFLQA